VRRQLCVFRNNSINDNSISGNKRLISTCASTTDRPPDRPTDQSLHRPIDLFKAYCCRHPTDECLAACLTASTPARPPACLAPCLPACLPACLPMRTCYHGRKTHPIPIPTVCLAACYCTFVRPISPLSAQARA
jgi:hypothetical protein